MLVDPTPAGRDQLRVATSRATAPPRADEVALEGGDGNGVAVMMTRRTRENGQFDADTVFDPLAAMQNPDSDLGPVISQKIITNQHGQVDAWHEAGRVTMRVVLPLSEARAPSDQEVH